MILWTSVTTKLQQSMAEAAAVVLMIENYRTGLLWNIMRRCPPVVAGLQRTGFRGGWLSP
jgi:hypothetical protein